MMRDPRDGRTLLLVEDSLDDVLFFRRAWHKAGQAAFQRVEDGESAVAYLEGRDEYRDRVRFPLPSLVVLDLKLPRKHGLEVLAWIRGSDRFRALPVVVLTSSREAGDIAGARALGVTAYHVKPVDARELHAIAASIAAALPATSPPEPSAKPRGDADR